MHEFLVILIIHSVFSTNDSFKNDTEVNSNKTEVSSCSTNNYPFMISIRETKRFRRHLCGGTLITRDLVLTAAHCIDLDNFHPKKFIAVLFTSSFKVNGDEQKNVRAFYTHPKYKENPLEYDVGLVKLKHPFFRKLSVVKMPPKKLHGDLNEICQNVLALGWGVQELWNPWNKTQDTAADVFDGSLRCAYMPVLYNLTCIEGKDDVNFCTIFKDEGKDSCIRDTGGPLLCKDIQYGIMLHALCGVKEKPAVHLRVDRILDFIQDVTVKSRSDFPQLSDFLFPILLIIQFGSSVNRT
ncbi:hypothetical protein HHI36_002010 [Cryptolaemus montrouzieri]|uniref:Peptidase S1 domain-containing protein n=1 Tax=Cryptolaemus montrouzieri TaxID=559131 RepID=A0ABD2P969_9CUCU